MGIDIDVEGLCSKCKTAHEQLEFDAGRKIAVQIYELCDDCKIKLGLLKPQAKSAEGDDRMKKKRKYTKRADKAGDTLDVNGNKAKAPKLDKETKRFIKNILKSGKKAAKLEAKAEKYQIRADELSEQAASMRAGVEALKDAVEQV
jgi:hypothetical protein